MTKSNEEIRIEEWLAYKMAKACLESELEEDPDLLLWMEDG